MIHGPDDIKMDADTTSIKIVVAGTIAAGKTTLLGALSVFEGRIGGESVEVEPYSSSGTNSTEYTNAINFKRNADNCFNGLTESPNLDEDPWPGATNPNAVPAEIGLQIVSRENRHRVSFHDFAGETFLGAFDRIRSGQQNMATEHEKLLYSEKIKKEVGDQFVKDIEGASIVLIVISCKDIIDFPELWSHDRNSAERMQFAYALMAARAEELQRTNRDSEKEVKVFFVLTQCDQYKALLSSGNEVLERGLKRLIGGMSRPQIERIYTSSAYQTELKKIRFNAGKSQGFKFCPISASRRNDAQPFSLGIKELVQHICNVSSKVAANRIRKIDEESKKREKERKELEEKFAGLARSVKDAMVDTKKIIAGGKVGSDRLMDLNADEDRLARTLRDYNEAVRTCDNTNEGMKAIIEKIKPDIDNVIDRHNGLMRWCH